MNASLLQISLHAMLLSAAAFLLTGFIRRARPRAALAMAGLLISGTLPWPAALNRPQTSSPRSAPPTVESTISPVSLPAWTVIRVESITAPEQSAPAAAAPVAATGRHFPRLSIGSIWLAGAAAAFTLTLSAAARTALWKRRLEADDDLSWESIHRELPDCRRHEIRLASTAISPCVAGLLRPVIVIPRRLLSPGRRRELRWALRHEWSHHRGHDTRWHAAASLVRAIFWWNPFAHLLAARWAAAREQVCDLAAAGEDADRTGYGEFLISLAAAPSRSRMAMARGPCRRLRKRIVSLLSAGPDALSGRRTLLGGSVLLAFAALLVSTLRIAGQAPEASEHRQPQAADSASPTPPAAAGKHLHLLLQPTFILSDRPLAPGKDSVTREAAKAFFDPRLIIRGPHLEIISLPKIAARAGEPVICEMIREHPEDGQLDEKRHLGWKLSYRSRYDGESVELEADLSYGFVPGKAPQVKFDKFFRQYVPSEEKSVWDDLVTRKASNRASLSPDDILITRLGEIEHGIHAILITSIQPIDSSGHPVADYPSALHYAPKMDFSIIRLSGFLLDLPSEDVETSELPTFDPNSPHPALMGIFPASVSERLAEEGRRTSLPTIRFRANRIVEPWDDKLPGLAIGADLFEGEGGINLKVIRRQPDVKDRSSAAAGIGIQPKLHAVYELDPPANDETRRFLFLAAEKAESP